MQCDQNVGHMILTDSLDKIKREENEFRCQKETIILF